jgi:hypothetical protein
MGSEEMMNAQKLSLTFLLLALSGAAFAQSKDKYSSGADREEGWIVRKTKEGIVKIPRKQYFSFEGLDVSGKASAPGQGILGQRPPRRNVNLIPERRSYREESLLTVGY